MPVLTTSPGDQIGLEAASQDRKLEQATVTEHFLLSRESEQQFRPQTDPVEVRLDRQTGAVLTDDLAIVPLYRPDLEVELAESWVSTRSGDKKPAAVVVHSLHTAAPAVFGTLLYVGAGTAPLRGASSVPRLMDLRVEPLMSPGETNSLVTALALECDGWRDILILDPRPGLNHKRAGPYETDAALAYVRWRADESAASRIVLRRGTTLAQAGRSLVADAGPEDMVEIVRPSDEVERHGARESYVC